jgi:hypothetical protein
MNIDLSCNNISMIEVTFFEPVQVNISSYINPVSILVGILSWNFPYENAVLGYRLIMLRNAI